MPVKTNAPIDWTIAGRQPKRCVATYCIVPILGHIQANFATA